MIAKTLLATPLETHSQTSHQMMIKLLDQQLLCWQNLASITEKIRQIVFENLISNHKMLSADDIANTLGISERSLYRKLATDGSNLRDLAEGVRMDYAESLMQNKKNSLTLVAEKTGFSSLSSFSKAFKKYKDVSPSILVIPPQKNT